MRRHVELAHDLAGRLGTDERFEVVAPVPLNLVCFRHVDGDDATQDLMTALNASGEVALTHTRLADRFVIRISVGALATERRHVDRLWELIDQTAARVR